MKLTFRIFSILLFILLLCTVHQANAQSKHILEIGEIDSLYSDILHESREIYIQMPDTYHPESARKYPVVYVLDGETILNAVTTVHSYYWGGFLPEMIIIGISNRENRERDLLESSTKFNSFLEKELIPYIERKYPVTDYRTLIGHSLGGYFAINTLINDTDLFDNYLAIDPSLDRNNQELIIESKEAFSSRSFKGKSLFISLGGQLHMQDYEITIDNVMNDSSEATLFARSNIEFFRTAEAFPQNGLNIMWKYYPHDIHGTVPLPSVMDGLIFLFTWYQMEDTDKFNNPETPVEELLHVIRNREKKLEAHFGYKVPPYDEELFIMLGYMSLDMDLPERSLAFFLLGIEYYPSSANAYDSLADYYLAQNDNENALKYVLKAFELSGSDYHKERMEKLEEDMDPLK